MPNALDDSNHETMNKKRHAKARRFRYRTQVNQPNAKSELTTQTQ